MAAVLVAVIIPVSSEAATGRCASSSSMVAHHPVSLSLFPPISTNGSLSGNVATNISLNILGGYVGELRGFELGTLFNVEAYDARWIQLAGGVNVVGVGSSCAGNEHCGDATLAAQDVNELCGREPAARLWGDFTGFQLALLGNFVMRDARGVQIGGANVAGGEARCVQLGAVNYGGSWAAFQLGGLNLSWGDAGMQLGLFDLARGNVSVAQISGVNIAGENVPIQLGGFNATGGSAALQLGAVNAARQNTGLTLGGVNFGGGDNGVALGAANLIAGASILQLGGVNVAGEDATVQFGGVNATGGNSAAQIGGFNLARHNANFTLGAVNIGGGENDIALGGVNFLRGSSKLQLGAVNVLGNQAEAATVSEFGCMTHGTQSAEWPYRTSGLQAGLFNLAGGSIGVQVGAANVAGEVRGFQFGAFNFAQENEVAIGPLNVILNGQMRAHLFASEAPLAGFELKTGGRSLYNVLAFGYHLTDPSRVMIGYGIGGHFPRGCSKFFVDADLVGYRVNPADEMMSFDGLSYLAKARLTAGWEILPRMAVTGGLAANVWLSDQGEDGSAIPFPSVIPMYKMTGSTNIAIWPGAALGLEFRVI